MMLKCKITPENFALIKSGKKTVELRELEGITFSCGKETLTKKLVGFRQVKDGGRGETDLTSDLRQCFPNYLSKDKDNMIVMLYLDGYENDKSDGIWDVLK